MMECAEFLAGYSDYRDGLLGQDVHERFQKHLDSCPSCSRYDRVVASGIDVLLRAPEVTPSEDFSLRLQYQLAMIDQHKVADRSASGTTVAMMLAIAVGLGAAAWLPALRLPSRPLQLPPVAASAPRNSDRVLPLVLGTGYLPSPPVDVTYMSAPVFRTYTLLGSPSADRAVHFSRLEH